MAVKLSDICYIKGWSKQRIERWIRSMSARGLRPL